MKRKSREKYNDLQISLDNFPIPFTIVKSVQYCTALWSMEWIDFYER